MSDFERIVVGLDLGPQRRKLSAGSRVAAERARQLAAAAGSEVLLVHSLAADEYWVEGEEAFVWVEEGSKPEGQKRLEELLAEFRAAGIRTELLTTANRADRAIHELVRQRGVDLVVTGKRSELTSDSRSIGSIAIHLLRHCPCDVWAVKPGAPSEPRRILLATDLSSVGDRVLVVGAALAKLVSEPELHVVHAFQIPLSVQMEGGVARSDYERKTREAARSQIEAVLREAGAPGEPEIHVGATSPTGAILEAARRIDPDVAVMGTVSRGGLPGLLEGNTAERLFGRLDCSLLVVKPDDFAKAHPEA